MIQCRTDSDGQIVPVNSEEDQMHMDLYDILKACKALRKPIKNKGMSYKLDVIKKMVDDITYRVS